MPQVFHVLRCYSCKTFQVHQIKKSTKWSCKVCGDKQSIKQVWVSCILIASGCLVAMATTLLGGGGVVQNKCVVVLPGLHVEPVVRTGSNTLKCQIQIHLFCDGQIQILGPTVLSNTNFKTLIYFSVVMPWLCCYVTTTHSQTIYFCNCIIVNFQVLIKQVRWPMLLCCLSTKPTRVTIMLVTFVAMPCKMCIWLVFESNASNILIKYRHITSVMVKYKCELHCISITNMNNFITFAPIPAYRCMEMGLEQTVDVTSRNWTCWEQQRMNNNSLRKLAVEVAPRPHTSNSRTPRDI